jgi:hypothetical protein
MIKSLRQVGGLPGGPEKASEPKPLKGFNAPSPQPKMTGIQSHSKHSATQSEFYKAKVMGQDPRLVDEMNPTKTLKASRSFPGLANGE